ncbi:macro domain-containing protein [Bacillus subtilis]
MIVYKTGDILMATEDIICQQVNCKGVMGAGLAKQIRKKYPKCFEDYSLYVENRGYDADVLLGGVHYYRDKSGKVIANLFGQNGFGREKQQTDYTSLRRAFHNVKNKVTCMDDQDGGKSVAIPYGIGCGLAGGNWDVVQEIIDEVFADYEVSVYKFK